jgi:hypothetical protein
MLAGVLVTSCTPSTSMDKIVAPCPGAHVSQQKKNSLSSGKPTANGPGTHCRLCPSLSMS